jgi:hypothetical protein
MKARFERRRLHMGCGEPLGRTPASVRAPLDERQDTASLAGVESPSGGARDPHGWGLDAPGRSGEPA